MKRTLLFISCMLVALTMSAQEGLAVGDMQKNNSLSETRGEEADPIKSLYGEWWLVGWNDGGTWYEVDKKNVRYHNLSIEFNENGYVTAYSMANSIGFGRVTLNGNEMHFDGDAVTTMVFYYDMESIFYEDYIIYIKSYQLDGKRLRLYYTDNDYFVFTKDLNDEEEQADYIPFVELGKQWHVVSNPTNPYAPCSFERYEMYDEVERDGKTYVHIRRIVDGKDTEGYDEIGLFREENRRVYKYEGGRDVMLYDFSLKEGDTFTYEYGILGEPMNCKVLKQGCLEDGPQIQMLDSLTTEGEWTFKYRKLRTWTIGVDNGSGEYKEAMTWIEGVGTLINTFIRPYATGVMSCLAYIYRIDRLGDNDYLPFSLYNMYGPVYGCELPKKGAANYSEDWHVQYSYELEGDRLHVSGNVVLNCGGYYYAYFTEERTDDPMVRKLHFRIEEIGQLTTCMSHYTTDFYVSGFDPSLNYIIVDNIGEEHPVINKTPQMAYRPFVEDGKVWKVGDVISGNPVPVVDYYYFDGDTIVDGKTCKQMMRQRYINPDYAETHDLSQDHIYVGAWYEEDKKVYFFNAANKQFKLMYDFSINANDTLQIDLFPYVIGPRKTGGIQGFKGVYRDVLEWADEKSYKCAPWMEGVGVVYGPPTQNVFNVELADPAWFLMECYVGDEVIYLIDGVEDGATPAGARKNRFDFTHTTKEKPKTRNVNEEAIVSLYGEYNEQQLSINLCPINDSYIISITDDSGKAVYEKAINTANIVGLNIDISTYPEGRYIVTVDNNNETFIGEFDAQLTGIEAIRSKKSEVRGYIYNLQGQRLSSLQKGLNIVNGKKVYVR